MLLRQTFLIFLFPMLQAVVLVPQLSAEQLFVIEEK
jgi:hypothetical protein